MSADVHAHNYANRFRINREYEFRAAAGSKLGIETDGNRTNYVNRNSVGPVKISGILKHQLTH